MNVTPYAAFGSVLYICSVDDISYVDKHGADSTGDWRYIIKGSSSCKLDDGTTTYFPEKSVVINSKLDPNRVITVQPNTSWICIPKAFSNFKNYPKVTELNVGDSFKIKKGENVFLISGDAFYNTTNIKGPYQLRVRTADILLTAVSNCLLLTLE